jgi:hypothetical protein
MVGLPDISVGDTVKIVDSWNATSYHNKEGKMDCFLGTAARVTRIDYDYGSVKIAEDEGRWAWHPNMLDHIVSGESNDFEPAGLDELSRLIFGNKGVKT